MNEQEVEVKQSLSDFLIENNIESLEDEVVISERLKNFKFKIKAISQSKFIEIQKLSTKVVKKNVEFDSGKFNIKVILAGCVYPNFNNAEFIEKCGAKLPEMCITKKLLPGEIAELSKQILKLSGFDADKDINDEVEEVKNS